MFVFYGLVSLLVIFFHLFLILCAAPLVMIGMKKIDGKIQGMPTVSFRREIGVYTADLDRSLDRFVHEPLSFPALIFLLSIGMLSIAALCVPVFTTNGMLHTSSDILFIISLLVIIPCLNFFIVYQDSSLLSFKRFQRIMIQTLLFIPMLVLTAMVCRMNTTTTVLNDIVVFFHHSTRFIDIALCPLLICACSLLFLVMDIPDLSDSISKDGFSAEDTGLLLYINALQFTIWLSLIAFLLWPQSIAILDFQSGSFLHWIVAAFFGLLAWGVKIFLVCFILSIMRNFLFISKGIYKVGVATALNVLAVIIYFAGLSGM